MAGAKSIVLTPIDRAVAYAFVKRWHYSGTVPDAQWLRLGAWLDEVLVGVLTFGYPIYPRKARGILSDAHFDSILQLGRLAFVDDTPRNAESRSLAVAVREIRRRYPQFELLQTFADAAQCGDGTIYRAAGFDLIGIRRNNQIWRNPDGHTVSRFTVTKSGWAHRNRGRASMQPFRDAGYEPIPGFQWGLYGILAVGEGDQIWQVDTKHRAAQTAQG